MPDYFANNCLYSGRDDNNSGTFSPDYGIVVKELDNSIIKNNTLSEGAVKKLIANLGGHGPNLIIKDNIGTLHP